MQLLAMTEMYPLIMLQAVVHRAVQIREEWDERLAETIRHKIVEAWNKGKK